MKNSFGKILASRPVNKQAAIATAKGFQYTSPKKHAQRYWEAPPKCKPIPNDPLFTDYTGRVVGRLTAVGYLGDGWWLVRCRCGGYQARRRKAFNNPNNQNDRCDKCRHVAFLRMREAAKVDPTIKRHILDF